MKNLFYELRRRNVFRIGIAYLIVSWILLQITDVLVPILLLPDWVPRLIFLMLAIGFFPALIFAWAYELTPDGIRRETDIDPEQSIATQTGRKLDYLIVAILAIAVVVLLADKYLAGPSPTTTAESDRPPTIAVLPFDAMSSNEEDEHFADGLTEELLNSLAKISELGVVGRTSSFYYKDNPQDLREIGESLQVAHVLEGSVRRDGDQLRITAQLIQTDNGFHIWTETYDRTFDDIFAIQEDIAERVADAMHVTILGREAEALREHGTTNPEAHSRFLIASAYIREGQAFGLDPSQELDQLATARQLLEEAVEIDPQFANAWAMLAVVYHQLTGAGLADDSGNMLEELDAANLAEAAVIKAIELAPDLPEAWAARGLHYSQPYVLLLHERDELIREAESAFEKALELNPENVATLELYADFNSRQSNYSKAVTLYRRATELDPFSTVRLRMAQSLYRDGNVEEAWSEYLTLGDMYPNARIERGIAEIEFDKGHFHHGIALVADEPGVVQLIYAWPSLGDLAQSDAILDYYESQGAEFIFAIAGVRPLLQGDYESVAARSAETGAMAFLFSWVGNIYLREWQAANDMFPSYRDQIFQMRNYFGAFSLELEDRDRWVSNPAVLAYPMAIYGTMKFMVGETDTADRAWNEAMKIAESLPRNTPRQIQEQHHLRLLIFAARGETEQALREFELMVDAGWRWLMSPGLLDYTSYAVEWAWFEDSPLLDSIRDEPRFQETLQRVKDDNARMLRELRGGLTREDVLALGYH